ncbi:MAG: gephyrin-like molybdotransferase Glp [Pseudomonadota bacterium]
MSLLAVEDAIAKMLADLPTTGTEAVPFNAAVGRILADDVRARLTQPPFDASSMDGYAVRAEDVAHQSAFECVAEVAAGHPIDQQIEASQCARIFTGAPLPPGTDSVIIQENASVSGTSIAFDDPNFSARQYVRPKGMDFAEGDHGLNAGTRLEPRHLALAAAMNHPTLSVRTSPKIAILATGDELVSAGSDLSPGQIVTSNSHAITALCQNLRCEVQDFGIARDNEASLRSCFDAILEWQPDVVVTLGGASVGDHDLVRPMLESYGFGLDFWRIAMRPGRPLMHARRGRTCLLGLPGNPVSAIVCGQVFLKPLILGLMGARDTAPVDQYPLDHPLPENSNRMHYMRARRTETGVTVFENQDSSLLRTLSMATHLVMREPHAPARETGQNVPAIPIN